MPEIQAFRGLRYDLGHVGNLSDVVAPPYDVISPELQTTLYKKHPANVIRLILNRDEQGDDAAINRYSRAASFLSNWRGEGVLREDAEPALYVYHQSLDYGGKSFTRRGFMVRCRLERFGEGNIFPHEETMSGPKQDRLLLTRACRANLSQIFGLYPDATAEVQTLVDDAVAQLKPIECVDHLGVKNRMWVVTDRKVIAEVASKMAARPLFIADGHHRYETACNYRDELAKAAGGSLPADHPANSVLMMCVGMNDPGLLVFPTHRLFRGLPPMSSDELVKKLGGAFATRLAGEGADLASTVWREIESEGAQGTIGFFTTKDERWVVARVTDEGRRRMAEVAGDHSRPWQELGVSLLHRLVVDTLLGAKNLPKPEYVHLVDEVVDCVGRDEFQLAALVMPATVEHIRVISEHHERMPAKSTYFYPKLLCGLVVNPLDA